MNYSKKLLQKIDNECKGQKEIIASTDSEYIKLIKQTIAEELVEEAKSSNVEKIKYKIIDYKNKKYIVGFTSNNVPFVVDYKFNNIIPHIKWSTCGGGYISTSKSIKKISIVLLQHNLVMNKLTFNGKGQKITVDHINRIKADNRLENLRFQTATEQNYNQKMKIRKDILPKNSGISIDEMPRCVNYKYNKTNDNEFFKVKIRKFPGVGYIEKDSSKGKDKSLVYKFEEIKAYLRHLKSKYSTAFNKMNIENEKTDEMFRLEKEYYEIIKLASIKINHKVTNRNYLKADFSRLTSAEITELNSTNFDEIKKKAKDNTLPKECGITEEMLGKYIRYRAETNKRGEYFVIKGHLKCNKIFYGSSNRNKTIQQKFKEVYDKIKKLENG